MERDKCVNSKFGTCHIAEDAPFARGFVAG